MEFKAGLHEFSRAAPAFRMSLFADWYPGRHEDDRRQALSTMSICRMKNAHAFFCGEAREHAVARRECVSSVSGRASDHVGV
jgi:hypothetical protein